jgi:signal-transduction protein with cAMP-binding, CBS, and nucleotidyltransferase domain
MEATCFSEKSVDFQRTTRRYIPEDRTLHDHRCENLKSYISVAYFRDDDRTIDEEWNVKYLKGADRGLFELIS